MKYFVTGATGFLGGRVVKLLRQAGHEVHALVRTPSQAKHLEELGVKLFKGDIIERDTLATPMQNTDGVFHLAAWYEIGKDPQKAHAINVDGTRNVLEVMRDLKIPKGVYTSTAGVFGDTGGVPRDETHRADMPKISEYMATKWRAHHEVAEPLIKDGLPLVMLMPTQVYGVGDKSIVHDVMNGMLRGLVPMLVSKVKYNFVHVDDVAQAHVVAMQKGKIGESYLLGGADITGNDIATLYQQITKKRPPLMTVPPFFFKMNAPLMDVLSRVLPLPSFFTGEGMRQMSIDYTVVSNKAKRDLDWNPRSLKAILEEVLPYEMAQVR
jgi:dihydroflavonol-4-reductase